MVGPNYMRPEMPTPPQFRFVEEPAQAATLADAPWFEVFDDSELQALIREAIAANLDLRAAAARVEEARARAGISRSYLYPQVDGVAGYSVRVASNAPTDDPDDEEDTAHQSGIFGFQLAWELDLFGRIRRETEAATAVALATEQGRRGVMVTLVGDVASMYFLLRELDLQLDIARRTLLVNDETVTYFRNRLDGGVSNRLEVDRIIANRADTAAAIPQIEEQIALVETGLSLLLGRPPGSAVRRSIPRCSHRRPFLPVFRRRCSSGGRTSSRPSSSSWRPMRISAWPRRCSFRESASPGSLAVSAATSRASSAVTEPSGRLDRDCCSLCIREGGCAGTSR
jgi:multidrug efflux system outer membrane protein